MTQHKFGLVFDDDFVVRLDGLLQHVFKELKGKIDQLIVKLYSLLTNTGNSTNYLIVKDCQATMGEISRGG